MANPEAMEKLRAVLDYVPEEVALRLPGDPQEYYDALTTRLARTVAVKSMVKRKVIVQLPDPTEEAEPGGTPWTPPLPPPEPQPAALPPLPPPGPERAWSPPPATSSEATSVVEAVGEGPAEEPASEEAGEDYFAVVKPGASRMDVVEPDVSLSEREWSRLETSHIPEEEAEAPATGEEPGEDEAFEEIELPPEPAFDLPGQPSVRGRAAGQPAPALEPHGELEPEPEEMAIAERGATTEFEVEESGEVGEPEEFEVVEESDLDEDQDLPYAVNDFTLFRKDAARGGKARASYFFSAEPSVEGAVPSPLPEGFEVIVNETTGIPVIRRATARVLPVIEIEGLGPVMAERLERVGVRTTKDLLGMDARAVAGDTGISERLLANFRAMADLLQLPGMYPDQAAGLVYAGCRSLADLKGAAAASLAKQVNDAARDHQLKLRGKMTPSRIRGWQEKIAKLQLVREP